MGSWFNGRNIYKLQCSSTLMERISVINQKEFFKEEENRLYPRKFLLDLLNTPKNQIIGKAVL